MDEIRKRALEITKQELAQKPFVDGKRRVTIGFMHRMFEDCTEDDVEKGMIQLGNDLREFGLILSSFPGDPDVLCALEIDKEDQKAWLETL